MAIITVSYDNVNCIVGCGDVDVTKGSSVQWINDRTTVSSLVISNINPVAAFSTLPTQANGWSGVLNADWTGDVNYEISVTPVSPGKCTVSQRQRSPKIKVPPIEDKVKKAEPLQASKS